MARQRSWSCCTTSLADGVGGLNVLAALVDPGASPAAVFFPRSFPTLLSLARDAWLARLRGIRRAPGSWRSLRRSMFAGGGLRPPRATPCSLVRQTGPRRRMTVVRVDRDLLRAAAHRHGATTNDAVLVAIGGALHHYLLSRGEPVDPIALAVPVSGRQPARGPVAGNLVNPMLVEVPARGRASERLERVEATVPTDRPRLARRRLRSLAACSDSWPGSGYTASS